MFYNTFKNSISKKKERIGDIMELYENIKRMRLESKMSQSELAQRTGYADKTAISKIEKGLVDLSQSKIVAFAEALHTTPARLMGWEDETPADKESEALELVEQQYGQDARGSLSKYLQLDSSDKKLVSSMMDNMLDQDKYSVQEESKHA